MMNTAVRLVLGMVMLLSLSAVVVAQDDPIIDYTTRYEGIPFARTDDGGFVLGEADAPVTVVEFADFLCPHCQTYQEDAHQFIETYVAVGLAKFEYRLFPVVDPTFSAYGAQLAECADEQVAGMFWPAHDLLYDLGAARNITLETPQTMADVLGLDAAALEGCAESAAQYVTDLEVGQAVGVTGTPASRARLASGELGYITLDGTSYARGGVPFSLLETFMAAENFSESVLLPESMLSDLVEEREACGAVAGCWEGLIPGETSWDNVLNLIEGSARFTDVQRLTPQDPDSTVSGIGWMPLTGSTGRANQAVTFDGETLEYILLSEFTDFTTSQVLAYRGEPQLAVTTIANEQVALVDLFYTDDGVIVQVYVEAVDGAYAFSEDSLVIGAQYVKLSSMEELVAGNSFADWNGYEAFENYVLE